MERERATMQIAVDLDPISGAFHTAEDAARIIEAMLLHNIPHYKPEVTLIRS